MTKSEQIERLLSKPRLDRYDIAQLIGETVDVVAQNEARLGIAPARYNINARLVRYHTVAAIEGMKASGALETTKTATTPPPHK